MKYLHYIFLVFLTCWLLASFSTLSAQTCTLLSNTGFESSMTSWNATGTTAGVSTVTTTPHSGSRCAGLNTGYDCGIFQTFSGFTPGTKYNISLWALISGAPSWAGCGITWYTSTGATISSHWTTLDNSASSWTYFYNTVTPPANAVTATVTAYKNGTTGRLLVDDFCFSLAPADCGTSISLTNATDNFTRNGKILINNITANHSLLEMGPQNDYNVTFIQGDPTANASRWFKGLAPGNYRIFLNQYNANWEVVCTIDKIVSVGAGSLTTCSSTEIGGTVYGDYNSNGQRDLSEKGIKSITVSAFDSLGNSAGNSPQTTNAQGFYKITGLTAGKKYRLEFNWSDTWVRPGAIDVSQSSVQFTTAGTCNNDMGLNYPPDYCHTPNPYIAVPCYVNGNPTASAISPMDALVAFPRNSYSTIGMSTLNQTPVHVATAGQIGSVWAEAYQRSTKTLYTGAFCRRFFGFGPLGTGGIYKINMTNPAAPSVSNWINLSTLGINAGANPRNGTTANTLATTPTTPVWDAEAFNQVGKIGLGGMSFNDNNDTLWFVNLFDKKLYGIKNVSPSTTPTASDVLGGYTIALPSGYSCNAGSSELRPFAVQFFKGKVYVGAVCSGETTPWDGTKLRGYVLSFDPQNPSSGFTHVINFPLDNARLTFNTSSYPFTTWVQNTTTQLYAIQPLFTDIEFDVDDAMILLIGDRGGYQSGFQNYRADPSATNTTLSDGNSYGEILRVCKFGSGWVMEGTAGCPYTGENISSEKEYYWGDIGPHAGDTTAFREMIMGGGANFPGDGQIIATVQDPSDWHSGGVMGLNNLVGTSLRRAVVYDQYSTGGAGKATGVGDVELLCNLAPIEAGERVFADYDGDGIQDAHEPGIPNVIVGLYLTTGNTLVRYDTTDAKGLYLFQNLAKNTAYTIRIATGQTPIATYTKSTSNVGSNDFIDSDGLTNGASVETSFTTYREGYNDHSFDFGFVPPEICDNGIDDNFNGFIDENYAICHPDTCLKRVKSGLLVAYNFNEQAGKTLHDVSGIGNPLHLSIQDTTLSSWSGTCGINFKSPTILKSGIVATKLIDSLKASNAITIEAWLRPENTSQSGPARIFTLSDDAYLRNFTLGQSGSSYAVRLRTSTGTTNGMPEVAGGSIATTTAQHVVYTWDGSTGIEKFYVNNIQTYSGTRSGNLSTWDNTYQFGMGNEINASRPWLGDLYYAAVYKRALTPAEIDSNYRELFCCDFDFTADYDCTDGMEIDLQMDGINNAIPYIVNFADTTTIDSIVVEIVYKTNNPGTSVSIQDASGNTYSGNRIQFSTNAFLYKITVPTSTSKLTYSNTTNQSYAQSMVSYVFRNGQVGKQYVAQFTTIGGYNNIETLATWLPERTDTQNIRIIMPISEVTYDNRHLTLTASIGGISTSEYRLWGPSGDGFDNGCCVDTIHLYLKDVPPDENLLTVQINSTGGGQSYIIGATVWVAIACGPEVCDNGYDDDLDGLIDCADPDCSPTLPAITAQPQNDSICAIYGSYLKVGVTGGSAPFTYKWQYNNGGTWQAVTNNIPAAVVYSGLNSDSLVMTPFGVAGNYQYRVVILDQSSICDSVISNTASILVSSVIDITGTQPANDTICVGGTATFTVSATQSSTNGNLKYQWQYFNGSTWQDVGNGTPTGVNYTGKTSNALTIINNPTAGTYVYRVEIDSKESGCDKAYSANVSLVVRADPSIIASGATTICTGGTATLTASTSGGAKNCTIQWQFSPDGTNAWTNISGATSASYTTAVLTTNTFYRAIYSCTGVGCDAATSNVQQISVLADPTVNITGANITICSGGSAILTANVAGGTGTISYQWQSSPNGTSYINISGATAQTYNTGALTSTTYYKALISFTGNGCESATSVASTITIVPDPTITVTGENNICTGGSVTLTATTSGGTGTCTIQWQSQISSVWTNIAGATSSTYTTPNLTATTAYRARYSCTGGGCDLATSAVRTVTVNPDPTVTISAPNAQICVGGGVVLTATPSGGLGTCVLQWQNSTNNTTWTNISGATSTTYTTPALSSNLYYRATYSCDRAGCCD